MTLAKSCSIARAFPSFGLFLDEKCSNFFNSYLMQAWESYSARFTCVAFLCHLSNPKESDKIFEGKCSFGCISHIYIADSYITKVVHSHVLDINNKEGWRWELYKVLKFFRRGEGQKCLLRNVHKVCKVIWPLYTKTYKSTIFLNCFFAFGSISCLQNWASVALKGQTRTLISICY